MGLGDAEIIAIVALFLSCVEIIISCTVCIAAILSAVIFLTENEKTKRELTYVKITGANSLYEAIFTFVGGSFDQDSHKFYCWYGCKFKNYVFKGGRVKKNGGEFKDLSKLLEKESGINEDECSIHNYFLRIMRVYIKLYDRFVRIYLENDKNALVDDWDFLRMETFPYYRNFVKRYERMNEKTGSSESIYWHAEVIKRYLSDCRRDRDFSVGKLAFFKNMFEKLNEFYGYEVEDQVNLWNSLVEYSNLIGDRKRDTWITMTEIKCLIRSRKSKNLTLVGTENEISGEEIKQIKKEKISMQTKRDDDVVKAEEKRREDERGKLYEDSMEAKKKWEEAIKPEDEEVEGEDDEDHFSFKDSNGIRTHYLAVYSAIYYDDKELECLVTGSGDSTIRIFKNGERVAEIMKHKMAVRKLVKVKPYVRVLEVGKVEFSFLSVGEDGLLFIHRVVVEDENVNVSADSRLLIAIKDRQKKYVKVRDMCVFSENNLFLCYCVSESKFVCFELDLKKKKKKKKKKRHYISYTTVRRPFRCVLAPSTLKEKFIYVARTDDSQSEQQIDKVNCGNKLSMTTPFPALVTCFSCAGNVLFKGSNVDEVIEAIGVVKIDKKGELVVCVLVDDEKKSSRIVILNAEGVIIGEISFPKMVRSLDCVYSKEILQSAGNMFYLLLGGYDGRVYLVDVQLSLNEENSQIIGVKNPEDHSKITEKSFGVFSQEELRAIKNLGKKDEVDPNMSVRDVSHVGRGVIIATTYIGIVKIARSKDLESLFGEKKSRKKE